MKAIVNAKVVLPDRVIPDGCILFDHGVILASGRICPPPEAARIDAGGLWAGPGFVDEHLHGYCRGGERYNVTRDCAAVAATHLKHGTTTMTPSAAYNLTREEFISVIDQCNAEIRRGGTTIAGIHFEGPYTNPKYGSMANRAWAYSRADFEALLARAGENLLHCTYAPELACAPEVERMLAERGVIGDVGHTCAGLADMERAFAWGARIATHLFDAMGHRLGAAEAAKATGDVQESAAVSALAIPGFSYELICDSLCAHVSASNARMALRTAGEDRIILITDASVESGGPGPAEPQTAFAAAPDLNFDVNGELSGSYLTMNRACANFMRTTGADVRLAFKCASTNPAKALGLNNRVGSLEPHRAANIVLVDDHFNTKAVYFKGEPVADVRS